MGVRTEPMASARRVRNRCEILDGRGTREALTEHAYEQHRQNECKREQDADRRTSAQYSCYPSTWFACVVSLHQSTTFFSEVGEEIGVLDDGQISMDALHALGDEVVVLARWTT